MTEYYREFPFKEIRRPNGNYFETPEEAMRLGYKESQIWSVVECDGTYTYGPPYHYINRIGYIATKEQHDGETYYTDAPDEQDCFECYSVGCEFCRGEPE